MSYCRFENTLSDLRDCYVNMNDDVSEREFNKRKLLIELCKLIADEYEYLLDEEFGMYIDDEEWESENGR